jgi:hypothetical protein
MSQFVKFTQNLFEGNERFDRPLLRHPGRSLRRAQSARMARRHPPISACDGGGRPRWAPPMTARRRPHEQPRWVQTVTPKIDPHGQWSLSLASRFLAGRPIQFDDPDALAANQ